MRVLSSLFGDEAAILRERDFQALLLAAPLPILGTALMSPILDSLIGPLGASSANIGLMISVFTAPAIVMIPVAGVLADRYGRKPVLVSALLVFGVSGTTIAFVADYRVVLALRFLQGVAFAGINPILITSVGDLYTRDTEVTGQGIRFMISALSGAGFPLLAGLLVLVAWQLPFLLYAVSIPVAIGVWLWLTEPGRSATSGTSEKFSYASSLLRLGLRRGVLAILIARALAMPIWIGFLTYNSLVVVHVIDGSAVQAALLVTIGFGVLTMVSSQIGRASAVSNGNFGLLLGANGCLCLGFAVFLFAPRFSIAAVGVATTAVGFGILGPMYRSILSQRAPTDLRAGLVSLSEASGRLTATLTPVAVGAAIEYMTPTGGFASALQWAGIGVVVFAGGGSIVCVIGAKIAGTGIVE